jgi:hypothetical protein
MKFLSCSAGTQPQVKQTYEKASENFLKTLYKDEDSGGGCLLVGALKSSKFKLCQPKPRRRLGLGFIA